MFIILKVSLKLDHGNIEIKTLPNGGFKNIDPVFRIHYLYEAYGIEGGHVYLFNDGNPLT